MLEDEFGLNDMLISIDERIGMLDSNNPDDLAIINKYLELKKYIENISQSPFMNNGVYFSVLSRAKEIYEYINNVPQRRFMNNGVYFSVLSRAKEIFDYIKTKTIGTGKTK